MSQWCIDAIENDRCFVCKHEKINSGPGVVVVGVIGEVYCEAFPLPNGVPDEIHINGHNEVRKDLGQVNDMVFEPDFDKIREYLNHYSTQDKLKWCEEKLKKILEEYGEIN